MTTAANTPLVVHDRNGFGGLEGWVADHAAEIMPKLLGDRERFEDRYAAKHGGTLPPGSVPREGRKVASGATK